MIKFSCELGGFGDRESFIEMGNLGFKLMALFFRFRDTFFPPKKKLQEGGIKPGFQVLDFGCGPGSFSETAAQMVGNSGKVYALDMHPMAIQSIEKRKRRKGLKNIEVISSDCVTGLPDASIDVVLLFDVLHELEDKSSVLTEIFRVMKPGGILSLSDHHLKESEILTRVTEEKVFHLAKKHRKTYSFRKSGSTPISNETISNLASC
jgi:ubiquinone/menaquinone biosynthesis C-methylase UbiE